MNKTTKHKLNNGGFSLVELIIVIAIMAILAGAIAPAVIRYIDKARENRFLTDAKTILDDAQADYISHFAREAELETLQTDVYEEVGELNGVDCGRIFTPENVHDLDLSTVKPAKQNAILYVDPYDGNIIACVYNNGRYTGYWKHPDQTNEWEIIKN